MTRPRSSLSIARGGLCGLLAVSLGVAGLPAFTNVAYAQAPAPTPGAAPAPARGQVTVNFVNADIEAVTRAFAAMIDRQIASTRACAAPSPSTASSRRACARPS
jgi:general secretion pathway protein D